LNCIPYYYYNNVMGIPWDGTGINCYGTGQINMSHGLPCVYSLERLKVKIEIP